MVAPAALSTAARAGRGDDGFTVIEVIVASLVLLVGILMVLAMYGGALRTTTTSNTRVAATNLARELVETAREVDYNDLGDMAAEAQARGLGAGTPWTIDRRGTTYTVTASTCVFDSPTDGFAVSAPANPCRSNAAGVDANGDDFRRVTFELRWEDDNRQRLMSQSTLVVNPAGGLGPRILSITPLTQTIITNVDTVDVLWNTTDAQSLRWEVDDGISKGVISGANSFTAIWNIGTSDTGTEVLDGSYTMTARSFDERDVAGESRRADIVLNRRAPYAPTGFVGGHNTRAGDWVEFEWTPNRERDILGYRVFWAGPDDTPATSDDERVCPAPAADSSLLAPTTTSCADLSAEAGPQKYWIVAVDRDAGSALQPPRVGDARTKAVSAAGEPPHSPLVLDVLNDDGVPRLTWTPPEQEVAFYRVYRDGTAYADRYDRTAGGLTTYVDTEPGTGAHSYWVTAVDSDFNESDPVGPVSWPVLP